jgi:NAD(P)-dependent dehydrogenase (short-subunit alcohol dehydrogenase family)
LIGFTKSCANAFGRYNVTANAITPGAAIRMTDRGLRSAADMRKGIAESEAVDGSERATTRSSQASNPPAETAQPAPPSPTHNSHRRCPDVPSGHRP